MDKTPATPDEMSFSDSDQQWFDRLTGKVSAVSDGGALHEADALRRTFELDAAAADSDPELVASGAPHEHERRWQELQFRLRREHPSTARTAWFRRGGIAAALAAGVLVTVVLVQRQDDDKTYYDAPPTLRGDLEVTRVSEAKPKDSAEALAQALRAAGLPATLHQRNKTFSVDVFVAPDTPPAALDLLTRAGAKSQEGAKRIEFVPH